MPGANRSRRARGEPVPTLLLRCGILGVAVAGCTFPAVADADESATVSVMDAQASEGRYLEFPLRLTEAREQALTVHWELHGDTALEGVDYHGGTGSTRISAGATETSIRIRTVSDRLAEPDDRFTVELTDVEPIPPDGAVVSTTEWRATGTITDDDGGFEAPDPWLRSELNLRLGDGYGLAELANLTLLTLNHVKDLTGLPFASGLKRLTLFGSPIEDFSALRHLPALEELGLDSGYQPHPDHGSYHDFRVWRAPPEPDLADLAHLPLESLGITGFDVGDLTPLKGFPRLTSLGVSYSRVSDLRPLAEMYRLRSLSLNYNYISDLEPLAGLTGLTSLGLSGNRIRELAPLANLRVLRYLSLGDNRITDLEPLAGLRAVGEIGLIRNSVSDIEPLAKLRNVRPPARFHLASIPLSGSSTDVLIPELRDRGVRVYDAEVVATDTSALEGEPLEFVLRLSAPVEEDVGLRWEVAKYQWSEAGFDFPPDQEGTVIIPAGAAEAVATVQTSRDNETEDVEPLLIRVVPDAEVGLPDNVVMGTRFRNAMYALGLIVDPGSRAGVVPYVGSGNDPMRQTLLRVINHHRETATAVRIEATDDRGMEGEPVTVAVAPGQARQFVSRDLEAGSYAKGLSGGVGSAGGDWWLRVRSTDVDALAYVRTADGLLASVHDLVPVHTCQGNRCRRRDRDDLSGAALPLGDGFEGPRGVCAGDQPGRGNGGGSNPGPGRLPVDLRSGDADDSGRGRGAAEFP